MLVSKKQLLNFLENILFAIFYSAGNTTHFWVKIVGTEMGKRNLRFILNCYWISWTLWFWSNYPGSSDSTDINNKCYCWRKSVFNYKKTKNVAEINYRRGSTARFCIDECTWCWWMESGLYHRPLPQYRQGTRACPEARLFQLNRKQWWIWDF